MNGFQARIDLTRAGGFHLAADFEIAAGETIALLGPNGAGKSTVVSLAAGLESIDTGVIELGGVVLDDPDRGVFVPPEHRRVGVVFQDYLLFPQLDVLNNVAFGPRSSGRPKPEARAVASSWLERLDIAGLSDRTPSSLSGGQAQRVALARALATDPAMLILDEPLAALDVSVRATLRRTLRAHLEDFAGPRMIITHDPADAYLLADRIIILENGAITHQGSPKEIRRRPRTGYAADLAGVNLLEGTSSGGRVEVRGGGELSVVDAGDGPVLMTIHPRAISVYTSRPDGSPRNTWETTVTDVEQLGGRVRVQVSTPLPLTAEITEGSQAELDIVVGRRVWLAIKATEIVVQPA